MAGVACGAPEDDQEVTIPASLGEVRSGLATPAAPRTPQVIQATTDTTKIFLWYADGGPAPLEGAPCAGKRPAAYTCSFGKDVDDCKRQVQEYLNKWYADFNVTFTFTRPTSGTYYTVVITSQGNWCEQASTVGGVAPINCRDLEGGVSYAFLCGRNPKTCASIIAQEHAHTVGLAHTNSRVDVMYPTVQSTSEGFENKLNSINGDLCRTTQNSYTMMLDRLGRWTGAAKPSPFGGFVTLPDSGSRDGGADGGTGPGGIQTPASPTSGDGGAPAPGGEAIVRPLPMAGDGGAGPAGIFAPGEKLSQAAGCSVTPGARGSTGGLTAGLLLALGTLLRRRRR